jgi:hypothetical protein
MKRSQTLKERLIFSKILLLNLNKNFQENWSMMVYIIKRFNLIEIVKEGFSFFVCRVFVFCNSSMVIRF